MGEKPVKYIISQRNILFVENNKIYHNGKEIEFEGDLQETVLNKKIEIYRNFFLGILIIQLFLLVQVHLLV